MFAVNRAPEYVAETCAAAARLQESTSREQYEVLVGRAERLLEGLLRVETQVDPALQVKIALRERFARERVKQAILNVATWQLIANLAGAWSANRAPAPSRAAALAAV